MGVRLVDPDAVDLEVTAGDIDAVPRHRKRHTPLLTVNPLPATSIRMPSPITALMIALRIVERSTPAPQIGRALVRAFQPHDKGKVRMRQQHHPLGALDRAGGKAMRLDAMHPCKTIAEEATTGNELAGRLSPQAFHRIRSGEDPPSFLYRNRRPAPGAA